MTDLVDEKKDQKPQHKAEESSNQNTEALDAMILEKQPIEEAVVPVSENFNEQKKEDNEKLEINAPGNEDVTRGTVPERTDDEAWIRVRRKLDLHILPLIWLVYMISYLDRSNIGNAREAGLVDEFRLTSHQVTWILTIFHIAYILNQWSTFLWKIFKPNRLVALASLSWGTVAILQSLTNNFSGIMACRFFLGILEPIYGAGVPVYLNFFYTRFDFGFRVGLFLCASPFSMCFAGTLAYGIVQIKSYVADWKLLFIIEGLPTIIISVIVFLFLPNSIRDCRFLTNEEKEIAEGRVFGSKEQRERSKGLNARDILATFKDPKSYVQAVTFFCTNTALASISNLLPTILVNMGYEKKQAQGLIAPPYAFGGLMTLATTYSSDRLHIRGPFVMCFSLIGALGYTILATTETVKYRYMAVFFCASGIFPTLSNVMPWMQSNQASDSRRAAGMAILQMIGQVGPVLGMQVFPSTEKPYFWRGMKTCAACMYMVFAFSAALFLYMRRDNQRRDKDYGKVDKSNQNFTAMSEQQLRKVYRWAL